MKRHNSFRVKRVFLYGLCVVVVAVLAVLCIKLFVHEKWQSEQIRQLRAEVNIQREQITRLEDALFRNAFRKNCTADGFDYLAIGNSITVHGICDYWWTERGMAASTTQKDYYHLVTDRLVQVHGQINTTALNLSSWETVSTDRAQTLQLAEDYLCDEIDMITVQLGENAKELDTFRADFEYLLTYLSAKAPNAKIIVVGDFWEMEDRDAIKRAVCAKRGIAYADLSAIKDNREYMCPMGTVIYDDDGQTHTVEHGGVASHPGDLGMAYIADAILAHLSVS